MCNFCIAVGFCLLYGNLERAIKDTSYFPEELMNDQMNAPMSSMPSGGGGPTPFYQVWINALTKPNEQTYVDIANSPNAKATTAYMWVFLAYLIESFFALLVQSASVRSTLEQGASGNLPLRGFGLTAIIVICGAPVLALIFTVFMAIWVALIQWVARMFGGRGTFDQLSFTFAAIWAPFILVSTIFVVLEAIPFVGLCVSIVLLLASLYILVLEVIAAKGVHQFGSAQAAGSVLIPLVTIFVLSCCAIFGTSMLVGASMSKILQQLKP